MQTRIRIVLVLLLIEFRMDADKWLGGMERERRERENQQRK